MDGRGGRWRVEEEVGEGVRMLGKGNGLRGVRPWHVLRFVRPRSDHLASAAS